MKLANLFAPVLAVTTYLLGGITGCVIAQREPPATVNVTCLVARTDGNVPLSFAVNHQGVMFSVGAPITSVTCRTEP